MMKWFRKKKKSKNGFVQQIEEEDRHAPIRRSVPPYQTRPGLGSRVMEKLPDVLIERVFSFVCPHTQDETYESCEQSAGEDACMLCDLRDLAHCTQVCKQWMKLASNMLYHSIRIDAVHYCELEVILAEKRKRRSKFNRNAEPENTSLVRLQLLCRTLRDGASELGKLVQFLKTPYMTRETCKADLARTVAVLPNLRYVDLPEGFFMDDPSCNTLKLEVQARCPNIRKMTFVSGAERSLESLASGTIWCNLEVLELTRLNMDPTILRQVLGALPYIRALKITDMKNFNDELFRPSCYLPPFPPLTELIFKDTPNLTADGLSSYLFRTDTQAALTTLSLTTTGVHPSTLPSILSTAPSLLRLSIIESVSTSFPTSSNIPPLSSASLHTLHYEITSATSGNSYMNTTASYYAYLASSLLQNSLPSLQELYVRDPDFAESLIDLAPPVPAFAYDPDNFSPSPPKSPFSRPYRPLSTLSSNNPFAPRSPPSPQKPQGLKRSLEVYSKGLDEMEWNFAKVQPPSAPGRRGSMTNPRPISSYGLGDSMGKQWAAEGGVRRSVIVGNGFGGFLAVPAEELQRPSSSAGEKGRKRGSKYDMWR